MGWGPDFVSLTEGKGQSRDSSHEQRRFGISFGELRLRRSVNHALGLMVAVWRRSKKSGFEKRAWISPDGLGFYV